MRPTKFNEEVIKKLEKFIAEMDVSNFWKHCSVHHIACLLGVHRDTIYEWRKQYWEFSVTLKKWEEKRNALFLELKRKDGAWIFLAKNWLGMSDKQEMEHSGDLRIKIERIITNRRPEE